MQIHQLTYFVAVARTRHFTRAADLTLANLRSYAETGTAVTPVHP